MDNTLQDMQNSPYDTKADSSNTVILVIANNYFWPPDLYAPM